MRIMNSIGARIGGSSCTRQIFSGLALLSLTAAAQAQFYAVTDLGTLDGINAMAYGINNREQIVGSMQTLMGSTHAFMFDGGRMIDLGTMGGSNSWAYGINDNGWMVGATGLPTTNIHAFVCTNALLNPTMMDLGTLGGSNSAAWMIDMYGDMVGWSGISNGTHHAFFMTNFALGAMMDLGTAGGTNSEAYCINSNRSVVGYTMMSTGSDEPIMSTNALFGSSSMTTMGMGSMGASGGQSWFVNDMGANVGQAQMAGGNYHAFISGNGGMMGRMNIDLGTLGGSNSVAYCLNNGGTVVGRAQMSNGAYHAFMVTNALGGTARMTDLNSVIPANSGWELMEARGINAAGQITGWGMYLGHTNAFLMTPVAAPVMMTTAPAPQVVGPGAMVTLQMQMSASEPLSYQWLHNGMPIPGATNATYALPGMNITNAGQYTVMVRNAMGTVASASAAVSMFNMQFTNGMPQLMVAAPVGSHFEIDYCDRLGASSNWQNMTNFTMMGSMNQMSDTPPQGTMARFYRAIMLP